MLWVPRVPEIPAHMAPSLFPGPVWASSLGLSSGRWVKLPVWAPIGIGSSHGFVHGVWTEHGKVGMCTRLLEGVGWSQEWEEKRYRALRNQDSKVNPDLPRYHDGVYVSS